MVIFQGNRGHVSTALRICTITIPLLIKKAAHTLKPLPWEGQWVGPAELHWVVTLGDLRLGLGLAWLEILHPGIYREKLRLRWREISS